MPRRIGYVVQSVISVALFVVAALVLYHRLRQVHLHEILSHLHGTSGWVLVGAMALTILNYLVLTIYDALALRYVRHTLAYRKLALASFIGYVFSNNGSAQSRAWRSRRV